MYEHPLVRGKNQTRLTNPAGVAPMRQIACIAAVVVLQMPDEAGAQSVRDSAGIRVVTHPAAARPRTTWRLDPRPILQLGGVSGTGATEFSDIWDVARTPDGGVVASDGATQELRVFDARGQFTHSIGRRGQGPGEFNQIKKIAVYGDTIYAVDTRRGTAVFLLDGTLVRHPPLPVTTPWYPIEVGGVFADGSVLLTGAGGTREEMQRVGRRVEMRGLLRIARDSRSADVLQLVPTYEHFRAADEPPGGGNVVVLAPSFSSAVFRDHFCMGRPVRYEVTCLDADGTVKQVIRRDIATQQVTRAAREAVIASRKKVPPATGGHAQPSAIELEQLALRTPIAESLPAYDFMMRGYDGELWVSDVLLAAWTKPYWEQVPAGTMRRWNVFARDGSWIAAIDVPARLLVRDIGRDYILGVTRDDDGVEGVAMYRLLVR